MQLFQRAFGMPIAGLWKKTYSPCLLNFTTLSLALGYITLLLYALVWENGNIVNLPTKRIGFYNFCLWNQEMGKLDCLMVKDLEKMSINKVGLMLSRICVYSTPVLCLFVASTCFQALCLKDKDGWKLACMLLAVCAVSLPTGLGLFLFQTSCCIQVSELGKGFAALTGAYALLLFHFVIIIMYLAQFKGSLPEKRIFPVRSLPQAGGSNQV